ncbi:MAG: hypothetical protein KC613_17710 [Myxococcales bacterium]|nr:hypothetical protein [Myxococcales bacterium]
MALRALGLPTLALLMLCSPAAAGELIHAAIRNTTGPQRVNKPDLKPHAALVDFELSHFGGFDHKVHAVVVRGGTGGARFELTDGQTRRLPTYDAKARWFQDEALSGRTATVQQRCRVRCLIPLPRTDGQWVLGGFSLRRPGQKEDFVLQLAVQVEPSQRHVEVIFRDKGRDVDFDAIVDLVSVPKALIRGTASPKGHTDRNVVQLGRPRRGELPLLAGFDVRFLNSDHKLRSLIVRSGGGASTHSVYFWDARPDDPFEAALQLVYVAQPQARRRR